ncbi:MAG: lamin tail domain-containing protein [Verrucomicrobiales bacterium]|nr:lamin tail domain-containing protein [Verrucomicrobiales bacterium]
MHLFKLLPISWCLTAPLHAAVLTTFDEASLPAEIFLDIPNSSLGNILFDSVNDELDFSASGNTDMWGARNNAPIAWTAIPSGLVNGNVWTVETEVRLNNTAQGGQITGITFYGGPSGARPDVTFGLDNWTPSARAVRLQGLGDNNPNASLPTTASKVILRAVVQEAGASDVYNFFFKVNPGDPWQQIPGVAMNYQTTFANSRVGLHYKTSGATDGVAFTYFKVEAWSAPPEVAVPPANVTAFTGGVARFNVGAIAGTSYQWRKNGTNIPTGGNAATLVVDPIGPNDNGAAFDCVVSNANGSVTSGAGVLSTANPPVGSGYFSSAVQAEPSLIAYFPVDGSTAPAVANVKSPSFGGTMNGDTGHDSTAARTIGTKSTSSSAAGWISVAKDPRWDFTDGTGTIEMWAYQTATAGYNPALIAVRNDGGGGVRYSFHADSAGTRIWYWNGTSAPTITLPMNSIGRLMHLAFVFNANNTCTLYHNGTATGTWSQGMGSPLNLPAEIGSAGPNTQESFPGNLDDIAVYSDALPASAILAHYNAFQTSAAGSAPVVNDQPDDQAANAGSSATFSVGLVNHAGAIYRWQKNGVDIAGATAASYTLNPATQADHGATFRCVVYNPYGGTLSDAAQLTVNDITPPVLQGAISPVTAAQVLLTFDEPVDIGTATFSIPGGTVTGAVSGPLPGMVSLTVTGLLPNTSYSVTANGVKDLVGNTLTTANTTFTAAPSPVPAPIDLVRPGAEPIGPATRRGPFLLSEIHYHPRDRGDLKNLEFIELTNTQPWQEDLTGFRITGEISYAFPAGTIIASGGRLVIAAVPADVQSAYSISSVLGPWTGSLNNSGGQVRLRDHSNAIVFEVDYDGGHPWPPAADGAGHSLVLARASYGMKDPRAWDASFDLDGSPGAAEPAPADPYRTVYINEIQATADDHIELFNYSSSAVDLSGCTLSDDRDVAKYVLPAGTNIPAGGVLGFAQATLGFALKAGGDTVYFRAPGSPGRVLDCRRFGAQEQNTAWGRHPDGGVLFRRLDMEPPGTPGTAAKSAPAVISEICYSPPTGSAQPPFVEIANLLAVPLDVSGWRLSGGVDFTIPAGTILAAGGRLAINAFSGSLNGGVGERIRLERPVADPDGTGTVYPVVDEVTYGTGGRWGRDSDGGGSSLEKRSLHADGRLAANWADSSEPAEHGWVTVQATGVMDHGSGSPINRLHVMLLGAGECLVDDVEVFQGAGSNVVTNPGFESAGSDWMLQGTHETSTVEAPGFSGGSAMHLRATGRGDLAGNRLSVPLTATLAANATATIRAKVKWLRGHPEILLRLAGGVLEATGNILPAGHTPGTPDAENSANAANVGPAIFEVTHRPVIPPAAQPVTVYAKLDDPDGTSLALLRYRIDPSTTLSTVVMAYRGAGIFSAQIPAQAAGKLAAFTISAWDDAGASSVCPADGKEGLIRWGEGNSPGSLGTYRLWMTQNTLNTWNGRLKNSNAPLDVTLVYNNFRPIYNATAQYSGSPWHSGGFNGPVGNNCDYDCTVPEDDRLLGATDFIFAGPGTFGDDASFIREQVIWWMARQLGLQSIHRRFCRVWVNGAQRQTVFEDTQQPNGDWIDQYWPGDNDGNLHKAQDWIEFADDGMTFGTTLRAFLTKITTTGGAHKDARYRYQWAPRSLAGSANDWTPFHTLVDAFATGANGNDPAFFNAVDPLVDQDSWMRALAIQRIAGNWDSWGYTYGKNMYLYKPTQGPWAMTAWDIDFSFGLTGHNATTGLEVNTQDPLCSKFRTHPAFRRAMWCAYREAVDGPMVPATANACIDRMVAGLAASGIISSYDQVTTVKNYIADRRNYILGQLNAVYPGTTFTLNGSSTLTDADGTVTLTGAAPPGVKSFRINEVDYTPQWTSQTDWSLALTLYAASNALTVQGLSRTGAVLGSFGVDITVTGPPALPPVTINEWMADNAADSAFSDPADGSHEDWFELHNAGPTPVNLSGFLLTDTTANLSQFQIPAGTTIPAGGWLLVWADNEPEQNGITPGQVHTNFRLNAGGEQIALCTPDGTVVDLVTFGPQPTNQSHGRYPDGTAAILTPVPTPGKRNALVPDIITVVDAGSGLSAVNFATEPTHVYQMESTTDLATWSNWGAPITAASASTSISVPRSDQRRCWRLRIVVP